MQNPWSKFGADPRPGRMMGGIVQKGVVKRVVVKSGVVQHECCENVVYKRCYTK